MTNPTGNPTRVRLLPLALWLVSLPGAAAWAGFGNTTNRAFNSRCNGPQGAIVVEHQDVNVRTAGVGHAVYVSHNPARLAAAAASFRRLQRHGLASPRATLRFPRTVVHTLGGQMILPDLVRTAQGDGSFGNPTNDLTFTFEGWSSGDEAALDSYLRSAMPKTKLIYGAPAFAITVKIIRDDTIQEIQGGTYDATTNEIRIPALSGNFPEDTYVLLMLVLNAFHDDAMLFYDAWEQGMIGAAAYAIQTQPGVSPGYDPIDPGPFYALSVYECENLPELGNSTYYPASGATNMLVWRIAMARAAWLKCWIENSQFFARFNERYYANFAPGLPGDVPSLKELAAQALPVVEGQPFVEWFERQYVLDTSVRTGAKLFTWNIPLAQAVALICELYETLPDGDESPFGGQARTIYWNYALNTQLYAEEGNLIDIPPGGSTPGEGFLLPTFFNIGGPQRITVQVDVSGLRRRYPFPYAVRGFDPGENNLYGAMLGPNQGTIDVEGGQGLTDVAVNRGVWGDRLTAGALTPIRAAVTYTTASGEAVTHRANIGWDSYCCLFAAGTQATQSHTYNYGLTGLHLMSLPLMPLQQDAAVVLDIPADRLLLAWWDPLLAGANKYRLWPAFPFANPGKGYWLRVLADTTVNLEGVQADTDRTYELPLAAGWNLIGSPRLTDVAMADLQVQVGEAEAITWDAAVDQRLVQNSLFAYTQAGGYQLADTIRPWLGYWVRCLAPNGVRLIFPVPTQQTSAAPTEAGQDELDWRLPLTISAGPLRSTAAYLGVAANASRGADRLDLAAPPAFGKFVQVRFALDGSGEQAGSYLTDVRPASQRDPRWDLELTCTLGNADAALSWPDLSELPGEVKLVLTDSSTGRRQYMRTTTGYSFRTGPEGGTRRLTVEAVTSQASLTVNALAARTKGGAATVMYTLSREAAVTARVRNIAGRPIRQLGSSLQQPAGQNLLNWDTRSDAGRTVPAGHYLVEIVARSDDGQESRALSSIFVER